MATFAGVAFLIFIAVLLTTDDGSDDGWEVGACVAGQGDTVEPVSCDDGTNDGLIVEQVSDPVDCPDRALAIVIVASDEHYCVDEDG